MLAPKDVTLTSEEHAAVRLFVDRLHETLADELQAVWLFGSAARGEPARPDSDIDLMVITERGERDLLRVSRVAGEVEHETGIGRELAAHAWDRERLRARREIASFFAQELDRDRIVLYERP